MSSKGRRKGKRQPKPRPKQVEVVSTPKTPHPVRTALKVISALIVVGMALYLAIAWGSIPDQVPTSFDAAGQPVSYTGKSYLLFCPIVGALLVLLVAALINDTRVWRFPFKIRDEARTLVDSIMNNTMLLLTLEIEIIFTLLTVSMAAAWNPSSYVMTGMMAAVIVTVVGGNILCWLMGGKRKEDDGSSSGGPGPRPSSFDAPPNSLGRRL